MTKKLICYNITSCESSSEKLTQESFNKVKMADLAILVDKYCPKNFEIIKSRYTGQGKYNVAFINDMIYTLKFALDGGNISSEEEEYMINILDAANKLKDLNDKYK